MQAARYVATIEPWEGNLLARVYERAGGRLVLVAMRAGPPGYIEDALALAARGDFLTDPEE